jgi:hypothetical protein
MTALNLAVVVLSAFALLIACGNPGGGRPVRPLILPDAQTCLERFTPKRLSDAVWDEGDPEAARCGLAISGEHALESERLRAYYLIYRLEGFKPEGLDAIVRARDRQVFAAELRNYHNFIEALEPFPDHRWSLLGCPIYDAPARELLLRTQPNRPRTWSACRAASGERHPPTSLAPPAAPSPPSPPTGPARRSWAGPA